MQIIWHLQQRAASRLLDLRVREPGPGLAHERASDQVAGHAHEEGMHSQ